MDRGEDVHFDTHVGPLRQASVAWLWAGYSVINDPVLVKKAFALCKVREWDLSYESLTSARIRARLRKEEAGKTQLWKELQGNKADKELPPESKEVAEDVIDEEEGPDDSDISPATVVADVTASEKRGRVARKSEGGGLCSAALADDIDADPNAAASDAKADSEVEETGEQGRPKRARKPNRHYLGPAWLYHDDNSSEDEPTE
ncbi:hypothetical protein MSAN_00955300 [Mycena sanguinolenta]|uniref:Uncharacterized protein n=1 Tax=Mycena sanguinolenta TaxID=230812 RepID=A0A8H6YZ67_9AGAR|nr:hypothetical protein MSAN_00955300 [Mycena sanguinolenta]